MTRNEQPRGRVEARGFTLVELLVVVAVLSILITLVASVVPGAVGAARRVACGNNLDQLSKAYKNWAASHGGHFPKHRPAFFDGSSARPSCVWIRSEPGDSLNPPPAPFASFDDYAVGRDQGAYLGAGALANSRCIDPAVMYCPASRREDLRYKTVSTAANGTGPYWPDLTTKDGNGKDVFHNGQTMVQISYIQRSTIFVPPPPLPATPPPRRSPSVAMDPPFEPVMSDAFDEQTFLDEQHPDGFNVLYLGGAVNFVEVDMGKMTVPAGDTACETQFTTKFAKK